VLGGVVGGEAQAQLHAEPAGHAGQLHAGGTGVACAQTPMQEFPGGPEQETTSTQLLVVSAAHALGSCCVQGSVLEPPMR
jgi:hypothetical protein